ncbi:DUF2730 family protein [Enterobacteriaceae bacterium YMB-R22]|uniref:DUF2730 family protein n=1 Tax=Tenebrionicola larvae TaxID=2815733 RepID=UPI0020122550|nr:DUF2730 family protein [Tenebrionicola larvae]MBV4411335.1 DUF2730 family protein [Tenebrionicola larvae]
MDFYPVLTGALALLSAVAGIAWWALRRTFASTERVERLENRLTEMEARYANMPGAEDMHEMRLRMADMSGEVKVLGSTLKAISHQLELLLENAVNGNKR